MSIRRRTSMGARRLGDALPAHRNRSGAAERRDRERPRDLRRQRDAPGRATTAIERAIAYACRPGPACAIASRRRPRLSAASSGARPGPASCRSSKTIRTEAELPPLSPGTPPPRHDDPRPSSGGGLRVSGAGPRRVDVAHRPPSGSRARQTASSMTRVARASGSAAAAARRRRPAVRRRPGGDRRRPSGTAWAVVRPRWRRPRPDRPGPPAAPRSPRDRTGMSPAATSTIGSVAAARPAAGRPAGPRTAPDRERPGRRAARSGEASGPKHDHGLARQRPDRVDGVLEERLGRRSARPACPARTDSIARRRARSR